MRVHLYGAHQVTMMGKQYAVGVTVVSFVSVFVPVLMLVFAFAPAFVSVIVFV